MSSNAELQVLRSRLERLYEELSILEQQLHPVITRIRTILGEFLEITPHAAQMVPVPEVPQAEVPRVIIPEAPAGVVEVREVVPRVTLVDVYQLLNRVYEELLAGVKIRSYTNTQFLEVPTPITYEGTSYDLRGEWDSVVLVPSIDAQISVNKPVEPTTPIIYANTALNLDHTKVRVIYYKGTTPGLTGKLLVFAFRY